MNEKDISNRHLLPVSGLEAADQARRVTVSIYIAPPWRGTMAGQHLVSSLVNLLCRQADLVIAINLASDDVTLLVPLPGRSMGETLLGTLEQFVPWSVGDKVSLTISRSIFPADFTIVIGCPDQCDIDLPSDALYAIGSGWCAWIGEKGAAPLSVIPSMSDPQGPFLAASFAAGEVFKAARGATKGVPITATGYSLWSRRTTVEWEELKNGPTIFGRSLPPMHIVGAGAVGQALVYTLVAANVHGCFITIDNDIHDTTNLNRCLLAGLSDVGEQKVFAIERYAALSGLTTVPFTCTVQDYLMAPKSRLPSDIAGSAQALKFPIVVSCVDKNVSRHNIQGLWPDIIFGASTLRLTSRSDVYNLRVGNACLACHNPPENDGEKIRNLESTLRAMDKDDRRTYLQDHGLSVEAIEDYLQSPTCGKVGESELRAHATQLGQQFSVGFVSLGAGVLLASELFKRLLFPDDHIGQQSMTIINFLNGKIGSADLSIDPNCALRCGQYRAINA
jgi:hypothetical protein